MLLASLATYAKSEGVLPAYFLGLGCAGVMISYPDVKRRLQTMTMTLLAPFYFLKAGTYIEFRGRDKRGRTRRRSVLRRGEEMESEVP